MVSKGKMVAVQQFLTFASIKESIVYKLINKEKNKELLEDIPYIEFLDMAVIFQCLVSNGDQKNAYILVHNAHLKLWDVTADKLYNVAKENTPKLLPHELKSIAEEVAEIIKAENQDQFDRGECMQEFLDKDPMYILSNKNRIEGAVCMLYPNLIKDIAENLGTSFFIIPSSVHELLLLPTKDTEEKEEIKDMIREINDTQVRANEILSYSLYYYDREEDKICIV